VYETPMEQAGLRKGRKAREQIVKISDSSRAEGSIKKCQTVS